MTVDELHRAADLAFYAWGFAPRSASDGHWAAFYAEVAWYRIELLVDFGKSERGKASAGVRFREQLVPSATIERLAQPDRKRRVVRCLADLEALAKQYNQYQPSAPDLEALAKHPSAPLFIAATCPKCLFVKRPLRDVSVDDRMPCGTCLKAGV